jgi:16S rRNA (guanine527-N7)-methyltransferase
MPEADRALAADRERALALTDVSRETLQRLDRLVALLLAWQKTTNLIAPSTIPKLWTRHIADSLQLIDLAPQARRWIDLGSGAGFPGLVIACALTEIPGAMVHLVESNMKKAAFLREAQRLTGAPAQVHGERIASFTAGFAGPADIVTARALAPLPALFEYCAPLLGKTGAQGLFPKGQGIDLELQDASKSWIVNAELLQSRTDPQARIVRLQDLRPRNA